MQKYFDLLLELLRPDKDDFMIEKKKLSTVGKKIEERGNRNLKIFHKYKFLFDAYDKLLNEKISLDEFLATGDITSQNKLLSNDLSSITTINSIIAGNIKNEENTLFILDSISFLNLSDSDKKNIQNRAKKHNCELIFC